MDPEWLPELALLLGGIIAGGLALHFLLTRRPGLAWRVGVAGLLLVALAWVLGRSEVLHRPKAPSWWASPKQPVLALTPGRDSDGKDSEADSSMSLVLGEVLLRVAPSDRYVLSLDGDPFLTLDSLRSGLTITCDLVSRRGTVPGDPTLSRTQSLAARLARNVIWDRGSGVHLEKPDPHTLVVREEGETIFRVRHTGPRTVEVTGRFFVEGSQGSKLLSLEDGIRWSGGDLRPETSVDLRPQGKGNIDFQGSGLIQVLPSKE